MGRSRRRRRRDRRRSADLDARGRRVERREASSPPRAAAAATRSRPPARPATSARTSTTPSPISASRSTASRTAPARCPRSRASSASRRSPTSPSTSSSRRRAEAPGHASRVTVAAIACDLDRTLIARGRRPPAAHDRRDRRRARGRDPRRDRDGTHVPLGPALRAGGRASRSRSSATRARPSSTRPRGEWLLHEPIPLELAREAIAAVQDEGFALNCYVDDDLYVAEMTENARAYADFQHLPINGGRRPARLARAAADEARRRRRRPRRSTRSGRTSSSSSATGSSSPSRCPTSSSSPAPRSRRAAGSRFVAEHLGFTAAQTVAFGDGENDLRAARRGRATPSASRTATTLLKARADWICPGPEERASRRRSRPF